MCGFYGVLFGMIPVPSHGIFCVTIFRDATNYFFNYKLVVVSIVFLIRLSLRDFICVVSVIIGTGFFLKIRCFGCTVTTDGIVNTILKYFKGVTPYCRYFEWLRFFEREYPIFDPFNCLVGLANVLTL